MFIAEIGAATAVGNTAAMTRAAVLAGISGYQDSTIFNSRFKPFKMAMVPRAALPTLDDVNFRVDYSFWKKHLLQIASLALGEMHLAATAKNVPLLLVCPQRHFRTSSKISGSFIRYLQKISKFSFDENLSRIIRSGRAAVLEAFIQAEQILASTPHEQVLVGGVDSFQRPEILGLLDNERRISAEDCADGFVPGEGAGFILVTQDPSRALARNGGQVKLGTVGIGSEDGHFYSDNPYRGEGLTQAMQQAFATHTGEANVIQIFTSMNGESYWQKELGVALTRTNKFYHPNFKIIHPADCFGDVGSATGAVLIALATLDLLARADRNKYCNLVCCSADNARRAAVTIAVEIK